MHRQFISIIRSPRRPNRKRPAQANANPRRKRWLIFMNAPITLSKKGVFLNTVKNCPLMTKTRKEKEWREDQGRGPFVFLARRMGVVCVSRRFSWRFQPFPPRKSPLPLPQNPLPTTNTSSPSSILTTAHSKTIACKMSHKSFSTAVELLGLRKVMRYSSSKDSPLKGTIFYGVSSTLQAV